MGNSTGVGLMTGLRIHCQPLFVNQLSVRANKNKASEQNSGIIVQTIVVARSTAMQFKMLSIQNLAF